MISFIRTFSVTVAFGFIVGLLLGLPVGIILCMWALAEPFV